jgi:micrococcal nuclease|tara:strand:+ start:1594 stop:1938 length:345 start_codon:yes stop_codon:yes gene_type:complete
MYTYNAKLDRVVDGDTVDATVDLGFDTWKFIRIRLVGINTPESRTRDLEEKVRGLAAKDFVVDMFEKHNNIFILESQGVGKYGRCLGNIFFGDQNLNDLLITEGHAVAYYGGKR